jgi:hypothetical protein
MEERFIEIGRVMVDPRIFETSYTCDVVGYGCGSMCCYRGCIVRPSEIKRIEKHLPGILSYLSPENREAIERNGSFVAQCSKQCPDGCDIHPEEAKAAKRFFKDSSSFKCTLLFNDLCIFVYTNKEGLEYCAIHSYALENRIKVEDIKKIDCIQYPLMVYRNNGKKVLALQDVPYLSHIPCMHEKRGEPVCRGLEGVIELLLGKDFNRSLQAYGRRYNKRKGVKEKIKSGNNNG